MKRHKRKMVVWHLLLTFLLLTGGLLIEAQEGRRLFAASLPTGNGPAAQDAPGLSGAPRAKSVLLADRDGDGLSDGLQAYLAEMLPSEPVDVMVTFSGAGNAKAAQRAVGPFRLKRDFKIINGFAATMTAAQARALSRARGVFRVEEDFKVSTMLDYANIDFGTAAARDVFPVDGSGVGICVVDTGVDDDHEQLDNGKVVEFADYVNGRTDAYDDHGHGTHVAAIAAGDGDPNETFQGVAPAASIYAAKVLDASGSGYASDVISGVDWCALQDETNSWPGVHIISMSLGSAGSSDGKDALSQAVNNAVDRGKTAVVAAGNTGAGPKTIGSPGAADQAITVGAVAEWSASQGIPNHSDGVYLAPFSSRGPTADGRTKPDIVSPGVSITSAEANSGNGYVTWSGTSMATPFVSGTVALALEMLLQENNPPIPFDVKIWLMETAIDRGPDSLDNDWGAGLLDGYAFVESIAYPDITLHATVFPSYSRESRTIPAGGVGEFEFEIGEADLNVPIAATLTVTSGGKICLYGSPFICDLLGGWAWTPDYDAELIHVDSNTTVAVSRCPLEGECGTLGRQETLHYMPMTVADAGAYKVRVYQFPDDPGGIQEGSVMLDLSRGPVGDGSGGGSSEDTKPPVVTLDLPATSDSLTVKNIKFTATDNVTPPENLEYLVTETATAPAADNAGWSYPAPDTHTFSSAGSHILYGWAKDAAGNVSTETDDSKDTVDIELAPPPAATTMHVGDLDGMNVSMRNKWQAEVTVVVHDTVHEPVSGATVSGTWSGGYSGNSTCTTDLNGKCFVASEPIKKNIGSTTFTVTGLSHVDYTYDAGVNHDPDGDSDSTTITVGKP